MTCCPNARSWSSLREVAPNVGSARRRAKLNEQSCSTALRRDRPKIQPCHAPRTAAAPRARPLPPARKSSFTFCTAAMSQSCISGRHNRRQRERLKPCFLAARPKLPSIKCCRRRQSRRAGSRRAICWPSATRAACSCRCNARPVWALVHFSRNAQAAHTLAPAAYS